MLTRWVPALRQLAAGFECSLNAAIFITLHIDSHQSTMPDLLATVTKWPVAFGVDGQVFESGHIYFAPPDLHMSVRPETIRLTRGPKGNFVRPAIDPLFRSAAEVHGHATTGILLTGRLFDGVAGLYEIQKNRGCTIIQNPEEASAPDMPRNVLRIMTPHFIRNLSDIPGAIGECVQRKELGRSASWPKNTR